MIFVSRRMIPERRVMRRCIAVGGADEGFVAGGVGGGEKPANSSSSEDAVSPFATSLSTSSTSASSNSSSSLSIFCHAHFAPLTPRQRAKNARSRTLWVQRSSATSGIDRLRRNALVS